MNRRRLLTPLVAAIATCTVLPAIMSHDSLISLIKLGAVLSNPREICGVETFDIRMLEGWTAVDLGVITPLPEPRRVRRRPMPAIAWRNANGEALVYVYFDDTRHTTHVIIYADKDRVPAPYGAIEPHHVVAPLRPVIRQRHPGEPWFPSTQLACPIEDWPTTLATAD